jgi:hypothetical protein
MLDDLVASVQPELWDDWQQQIRPISPESARDATNVLTDKKSEAEISDNIYWLDLACFQIDAFTLFRLCVPLIPINYLE